jgi:serine/threonine protein kinase
MKVHKADIARFKQEIVKEEKKLVGRISKLKLEKKRNLQECLKPLNSQHLVEEKIILGKGSFAEVYLATYEKKKVALKKINLAEVQKHAAEKKIPANKKSVDDKGNEDIAQDLLYEAAMLNKAAGRGVVELYAVDTNRSRPQLAIEYLARRNLEQELAEADAGNIRSIFHPNNIENKKQFEEGIKNPVLFQMVLIAREVSAALERIHSCGVIHLDISGRNILLNEQKKPKICDFGMSVMEEDFLALYNEDKDNRGESLLVDDVVIRKYKTDIFKRPLAWMPDWIIPADEAVLIDRHVDVYSFGCVMYELATKKPPHYDTTETKEIVDRKVNGHGNPVVPSDVDPTFAGLMKSCWEPYNKQPTMESLYNSLSNYHSKIATESRDKSAKTSFTKISEFVNAQSSQGNARRTPRKGPWTKEQLVTELESAMQFREHAVIIDGIKYAEECLGSEDVLVEIVPQALSHIAKLSKDPHASTDSVNSWPILYKELTSLLFRWLKKKDTFTEPENLKKIILSSLDALSSLIEGNSDRMDEILQLDDSLGKLQVSKGETEGDSSGKVNIINLIFLLFNTFPDDELIMEANIELVHSITYNSKTASDYLYTRSIVSHLLDCIELHGKSSSEIVSTCVVTLETFSLQQLIEPNYEFRNATHEAGTNDRMYSTSSFDVNILLRRWERTFETVFGYIHGCMENKFPEEHVDALTDCLMMIYRVCESSVLQREFIESFLYSVTADHIKNLYAVICQYPNHFRIQEGAIGILSHIVKTGMREIIVETLDDQENAPITNGSLSGSFLSSSPEKGYYHQRAALRDSVNKKMTLPLTTRFEDRVSAILKCDPTLKVFIAAMNTFRFDDRIAAGIRSLDGSHKRDNYLKQDLYNAKQSNILIDTKSTMTVPGNTSRSYHSNRSNRSNHKGTSTVSAAGFSINAPAFDRNIIDGKCNFDEDGEIISAASLQKSCSVILGQVCDVIPDVQKDLKRSTYNELILQAFQTFMRDVQVIQFGCYALFSICRRNAAHQRSLHELNVSKYLLDAFELHNDQYRVLDGIVMSLIGLLEPPLDYLREEKKENDCFRFAQQLSRKAPGQSSSTLQRITVKIAGYMMRPECYYLTSNYLKLLGCFLYWIPDLLPTWWKPELLFRRVQDQVFVDLNDLSYVGEAVTHLLQDFVSSMLKALPKDLTSNQPTAQASSPVKNTVAPACNTASSNGVSNSDADIQNMKKSWEEASDIFKERLGFAREWNLYDFIMFVILHYASHDEVSGSGLCILVWMFRDRLLPKDFQLGKEIDYSRKRELNYYRNQPLLFKYSIAAMKHRSNDPLLIRYSLWLLVIAISEKRSGVNSSPFASNATEIAAEIGIHGGVEWGFEVLKAFPDRYSLNCLAIVFLIWMEYHGRLSNRSLEKLTVMQTVLKEIIARSDQKNAWKPLEKEAHDTILINANYDLFGNVKVHADRLLRLVETHMTGLLPPPAAPASPVPVLAIPVKEEEVDDVKLPTDSTTVVDRPVAKEANKINKTEGEKGPEYVPTIHNRSQSKDPRIWNGKLRPYYVEVTETETVEDPKTFKMEQVYIITVEWDDPNETDNYYKQTPDTANSTAVREKATSTIKWTCSRTLNEFLNFQKIICKEYSDFPEFPKPSSGVKTFCYFCFFFLICFSYLN